MYPASRGQVSHQGRQISPAPQRPWPLALTAGAIVLGLTFLASAPAQAHHLMELLHLSPTPGNGLISGLLHPMLGPDHLLFLLALSLVGLRQRFGWMLSLLLVGLAGSWAGLLLPGLPGAEVLVALSLAVVGLVLLDRLPRGLLLPAAALHGYVLSAAVLGWSSMPVAAYLIGLALSQATLLLLSLVLLQRLASRLTPAVRQRLAWGLVGVGSLLAVAPLPL